MDLSIEVLIPDFQGDTICLQKVIDTSPDIIAHNIETTEELQAKVRDRRAGYRLSLEVLEFYKKKAQEMGFLAVVSGPLVRSSYNPREEQG